MAAMSQGQCGEVVNLREMKGAPDYMKTKNWWERHVLRSIIIFVNR